MNASKRNKVVVYVIDDQLGADQLDSRRKIYIDCWNLLESSLGESWKCDVHYCSKPTEVFSARLEIGQPVLALVDMVLDNDPWTPELVAKLDDWLFEHRVPILLISQHFHQPYALDRANRLTTRFAKHQIPFQFMLWQTIVTAVSDKVVAEQCAFPIGTMLAIANGRDFRFAKKDEEEIAILHITDPHFGLATWDAGSLSVLAGRYRDLKLAPSDFVAITGDVANHGKPAEYALAAEYLHALVQSHLVEPGSAGMVGIAKERVFLVPGNHDFARSVALGANIVGNDKSPYTVANTPNAESEWIQLLARHPYYQFEGEMAGRDMSWTPDPGFRIDTRFLSAGVLFLELDVEKNAIPGYQVGASDDEIRKRLNMATLELGKIRKSGECVVILAHRNEDSAWVSLGTMLMNFFPGLATDGPVVFLCGHEHSPKVGAEYSKKVLLVRGVPSVDGPNLPPGQLPKLHYVTLSRQNGKVNGATVHTFHQSPGEWLTAGKACSFAWSSDEGWR